jgi:hypothetical protein
VPFIGYNLMTKLNENLFLEVARQEVRTWFILSVHQDGLQKKTRVAAVYGNKNSASSEITTQMKNTKLQLTRR